MILAEKLLVLDKIVPRKTVRKIPEYLAWETLDGQPLYRRGYKDVLRKLKTLEEIIGTSSYQSLISDYIIKLLHRQLDDDKYDVLSSEIGVHLKHRNNLSNQLSTLNPPHYTVSQTSPNADTKPSASVPKTLQRVLFFLYENPLHGVSYSLPFLLKS
jgi:hypothetical protein